MDEQQGKITAAELVEAIDSMNTQAEGIRRACGLMVDAGIAELTDGIEVVNDIATNLKGELEELKEQLLKRGTA